MYMSNKLIFQYKYLYQSYHFKVLMKINTCTTNAHTYYEKYD